MDMIYCLLTYINELNSLISKKMLSNLVTKWISIILYTLEEHLGNTFF
jgi:predicted DNA-binding ArsR family transcriptional regulator